MHPEVRVFHVAERQRGVITYEQLRKCGVTRRVIDEWVATKRRHRMHRGVYVVGHCNLAPLARETAALLACGEGAVLTHRSAAILWDLPVLTDAVDVSVPPHRRPRHDGIAVHRTQLGPNDVTTRHGLPLTTAARTLHDLAPTHDPEELEHLIAEATACRLVRRGEVEAITGRRGAATVRKATATRPKWTRSEAERALKRLIHDAGLPEPELNVRIGDCLVDAVWRDHRIALEVDSWAWHGHRHAFETDRDRDMKLREAGFTPVRVTARQLEQRPVRTAAHLARLTARPG